MNLRQKFSFFPFIKNKQNKQQTILFIFLFGILLRLLIMPWFAHLDIVSVHRRVETIVCGSKTFFDYGSMGTHIIESFFAKLFSLVLPCRVLSQIQQPYGSIPYMNRMVFIFKIPYLLFEIGFWWLFWRFLKGKTFKAKKMAAVFLAFNPVIIYSVYMFGRFETYNLFFSTLLLFLVNKKSKHRKISRLISIGLLMFLILTIRKSYFLILPALLIAFGGFTLNSLIVFLSSAGSYGLLKVLQGRFGGAEQIVEEASWLQSGTHVDYLFATRIASIQGKYIYLLFFVLALIFIWWLEKKNKLIKKLSQTEIFALFSLLIFLGYYGTSFFHPQYFTWFIPVFLFVAVKKQDTFLLRSFYWAVPAYILHIFSWENFTSFGLLTPVSAVFQRINPDWVFPLYPTLKWANIGSSVLSAFCLYWLFYLIREYEKDL